MLPPLAQSGGAACGQDLLIEQLVRHKRNGVFVDIGANDGLTISNTCYLEKKLGWTGVAVEPLPSVFEKLKANRSCHLVNGCVSTQSGKANLIEMVGAPNMLSTLEANNKGLTARRLRNNRRRHKSEARTIEVDCYSFSSLVEKFGIKEIDFLSVDTEGGELEILKSIDYDKYPISAISVENNYYTDSIKNFLESQGYIYVGTFKVDEVYLFGGTHLRQAMSA